MHAKGLVALALGGVLGFGAAANGELTLEIWGDCPGEVFGLITGATPDGDVAILRSRLTGSFIIPNGFECAGLELDLARPRVWEVEEANENGELRGEEEDFEGRACGRYVQAIDLTTCTKSNVAQVPG